MDGSRNSGTGAASRRAFLTGAGLTGAAAVGVGVLAGPAEAAPDARTYTGGRFALEVDGKTAGALYGGDGGEAVGVVVEEDPGPDGIVHKHVSGVKYEDFAISCGVGMSKQFYQWMKASFDRKLERHDGRLTTWESDGTQPAGRTFHDALITEVTFPALDAASKDAAKMTIKFRPETTARIGGGPRQTLGARQKAWLCSNFRFELGGTNFGRVASIDSFTWKCVEPDPGTGGVTRFEIPNLVISLPEDTAKPLYDWYDDFVIKGNSKDERTGSLTLFNPDHAELFTLTFAGLGIWIIDSLPPTVDNIRRVKAELYCEQMSFTYTSAAWA